jgi:hypothetical protein
VWSPFGSEGTQQAPSIDSEKQAHSNFFTFFDLPRRALLCSEVSEQASSCSVQDRQHAMKVTSSLKNNLYWQECAHFPQFFLDKCSYET